MNRNKIVSQTDCKKFYFINVSHFVISFSILLIIFIITGCGVEKDPLTSEEREWLKLHSGNIVVNCEAGWPPIIDTDKEGNSFGIVMDYQRILEKKLNFKFKLDKLDSWENFMERFRKGEIDVNNNLQKTVERSEYAFFTKPYIKIPNAIIVRNELKESLSLEQMYGMKIAVTKDFALDKYIKKTYDHLKLVPFDNDLKCLLETSTKYVDAAVVNLAVASYLIEQNGISNLHVAGYIDYTNELSFASRKDWPILNNILGKGLELITQSERDAIYKKWISLGETPFYKDPHFWDIALFFVFVVFMSIMMMVIWNHCLRKKVEIRTKEIAGINKQLKKEINERLKMEVELLESKDFLQLTLDGLAANIALIDEDGTILLVNKSWKTFAESNGLPTNVVSEGLNYLYICDSANGDNSKEASIFADGIRSVLSGNIDSYQLEYPCHSPTEERWFLGRVTLFPGDSKRHVIIAHENITERKKAENALYRSKQKYHSIMEAMEDEIYLCSSDFRVEYMNAAMIKRVGRYAVGEYCYNVIYGLNQQCSCCIHDKIMRGLTIREENTPYNNNKTYHILHLPIKNEDDSISKLTVFHDISDIRQMERTLQQAQKMEAIGTLAGGIAHDFNNILSPIMGHTELLLYDVSEESPLRNSLNEIQAASLRAKDLVRQILTFSRQEKSECKTMKMQHVIKEALKLIRSSIPATIEIKHNIRKECGLINADPTQIHQIVMNLATNAYHAMEESGGTMTISLKEVELDEHDSFGLDIKQGTYACLTVSDTGVGIPEDVKEKIFDPFFTTKEKGKGTGIGLSVVHSIVNSAGGAICVNSVGKGTEFNIYLHVVESYLKKGDALQVKKVIQGGTERVLLVDDQAPLIKLQEGMLERLGYQVTSRTSSIEALEAFRASPDKFDMVITDMAMPNMSGDKLAVELIKIRPDIPILLCTGFSTIMSEEKATSIGIRGFVMKPITISELDTKIREVLDIYKVSLSEV